MSDQFYIRFNLHKSGVWRDDPWFTPDLFQMTQEEGEAYIRECEELTAQAGEGLKESYPEEVKIMDGKQVVFLGDSITSDRFSYRSIVTKGANLNAQDGSVSGTTSSALLISAYDYLKQCDGKLVSILLGANDSLEFGVGEKIPFVSAPEFERNLSAMVTWAKICGGQILLIEIPPVIEHLFRKRYEESRIHTNERVKEYNEIVRRIAKEEQVALLETSWLAEEKENFEQDGIHLSPKGHEKLAAKWLCLAVTLQKEVSK